MILAVLMNQFSEAGAETREQVVHRYYSPSGSLAATGDRREAPTRFTEVGFRSLVQGLPATGETTLVLHFMPGTHTGVVLRIGGSSNRPHLNGNPSPSWSIQNLAVHIQGEGGHPSETVLEFPADRYEGASPNGYTETGMISIGDITPDTLRYVAFTSVNGGRLCQARKVVVENLTLDCNWRSQRAFGSLYSPLSYKIYGAHVIAARGRFRNLIVRDHGSHGMICHSRFDNRAGVENFPLMVQAVDDGQEPTHDYSQPLSAPLPQGRPWLVEGCEIHGFNNMWGGYNTAVMFNVSTRDPKSPAEAAYVNHHTPAGLYGSVTRRFALVRNNQIRGGSYAFGQAGPGACVGSTFTGNVTVGASGAYNADTFAVLSADLTNNVFFDGRTGVRQVTHGFGTPVSINYHNVSGNLFRLDTYQPYSVYMDFRLHLQAGSLDYLRTFSDPNMVLGATIFGPMACLTLDGSTRGVRFEDNLITTRPLNFRRLSVTPSAGQTDFRPIWYPGPNDTIGHYEMGTYLRPTSTDVQISRNWLSAEADIFTKSTRIAGDGLYDRFDGSTTSAAGHLALLKVRPISIQQISPDGRAFRHQGTTERLLLFNESKSQRFSWLRPVAGPEKALEEVSVTLRNQPELSSVGEVHIAIPALDTSSGSPKYRGYARLLRHRMPRLGGDLTSNQSGSVNRTEFFQGTNPVRILISGPVTTAIDTVADSQGFVFYEFKLPPGEVSQPFKVTAYWNDGSVTHSSSNPWGDRIDSNGHRALGSPEIYQYKCAFSSLTVHPKPTVDITVTPNVANDRDPSFVAQRPVFTVQRSGNYPISDPLTVTIAIPTLSRWRFIYDSSTDRASHVLQKASASYGASSGQDYLLQTATHTVSPFFLGEQQVFQVKIPPGSDSTSFTLVPRYDDLTEEEVVTLVVLSGEKYVRGPSSEATVFIYDGPEFVIREVTDIRSYSGTSKALAINSDPRPVIVGTIYDGSIRGGQWIFPDLSGRFTEFQTADPAGYPHEPLGVSDTIGGSFVAIGSRWSGSKRIPWVGGIGSPLALPTLTSGMAGEALAVSKRSADETWVVGWSQSDQNGTVLTRPVLWQKTRETSWTISDLDSQNGASLSDSGVATCIDQDSNFGGWVSRTVNGSPFKITLGFHISQSRRQISTEKDIRLPLGIASISNLDPHFKSFVYAIGSQVSAAGTSLYSPKGTTNATIWRHGSQQGTQLFIPTGNRGEKVSADALAIIPREFPIPQWKERPVGRVWTNSVNSAAAVVWLNDFQSPVLLSDSHITGGTGGWLLRRPHGVNRSGSIVGEGSHHGVSKGFVLVSRK